VISVGQILERGKIQMSGSSFRSNVLGAVISTGAYLLILSGAVTLAAENARLPHQSHRQLFHASQNESSLVIGFGTSSALHERNRSPEIELQAYTAEDVQHFAQTETAAPLQPDAQTVVSDPSDPLALPRVPWEGGPHYYERFPQARAMGWTDPAFFPIAVWGATVENKRDVETDKEIGLNTYLGIFAASGRECAIDFEAMRAAGMSAIHEHYNCNAIGNETVGWLLADEPEQFGQRPGEVINYLRRKEAQFSKDGRMRVTNFTGNMLWPAFASSQVETADWQEINDLVSLDVYWYSRHLPCRGRSYYIGFPASDLSSLTDGECHRPFNYGYQIQKQIERARTGANKKWEPVFAFVENGSPFADDQWTGGHVHTISPDQMAASVWNSLIHGARGINYFNHSFSGDCQSSNNFRNPIYTSSKCYSAMRAKAKEVNSQIKYLAPVLNTQSFDWSFNPKLDTMLKQYKGDLYVFAMPTGVPGDVGSAIGMHTLKLPPGVGSTLVEVLFENRTIPISDGRVFMDSFASATTYHVYRIAPYAKF
jgi:hypothetical protein